RQNQRASMARWTCWILAYAIIVLSPNATGQRAGSGNGPTKGAVSIRRSPFTGCPTKRPKLTPTFASPRSHLPRSPGRLDEFQDGLRTDRQRRDPHIRHQVAQGRLDRCYDRSRSGDGSDLARALEPLWIGLGPGWSRRHHLFKCRIGRTRDLVVAKGGRSERA